MSNILKATACVLLLTACDVSPPLDAPSRSRDTPCHDYARHLNDGNGARECPRPEQTIDIVAAHDEIAMVCRCPRKGGDNADE